MPFKSQFVRVLVLAALLAGGDLWAEKISLYTGDTSRGGFGDVAANILMAQKVLERRPHAEVHVLVAAESLGTVAILEPGLVGLGGVKTVNGITYHLEGKSELPKTDIGLHFATDSKSVKLSASAPLVMVFEEYGGFEEQLAAGSVTNFKKGGATFLGVNAGAGKYYAGLYVSEKKPAPPMTRSALHDKLDSLPVQVFGDLKGNYEGVKIGFAYSHERQATDAYLEAAVSAARDPKNRNQKFLLIVQHPVSADVPDNVEIRYYKSLPFEVSKTVVAHSDIPILVTGDVSATLAVEYEKPFFYERLEWKKDFADGLERELKAANPKLKGASLFHLMLQGIDGHIMPMKNADFRDLAESLRPIFMSPSLATEMSEALREYRKTASLPVKIDRFLDRLEKLGEPGRQQPGLVFQSVIDGTSLAHTVEELAKPRAVGQVEMTPKAPAEAPKAKKNFDWDRPAEAIAAELKETDPVRRRKILEKMAEKAQAAVTRKVAHLLSLDPATSAQVRSIASLREILCGADYAQVKRPQ